MDEKTTKEPSIRFTGFHDAWEQRKLKDIASLITKGTTPKDKTGNGDVNFIKVENIDSSSGKISETSKISGEENEGYLKRSQLQENDILFSIAGTLGSVTSVTKQVLPANTNQALAIIRLKEGYLEYVKTCLKGNVVKEFIRKNPTIGAQPNLSLEQVSSLEISMPCEAEQKKIGDYFLNLDHLITLHQRELELLKQYKKSMLKKMFPQEGADVPVIRFDGFTNAWEQRKLSEVAIFIDGNYGEKYPRDDEFIESGVPFFTSAVIGTSGTFDERLVKYISNEKNSILLKAQSTGGDIILTNRGASMGTTAQIPLKYGLVNIGPQLTRIRGNENIADNLFLLSMFKHPSSIRKLISMNAGSAMPFIGLAGLGKFEFQMPKYEEQQRIGEYFANLDHLITLHQRELDATKEFKKSMLQKMFI